jgi:Protein of unknown function (DUF2637)
VRATLRVCVTGATLTRMVAPAPRRAHPHARTPQILAGTDRARLVRVRWGARAVLGVAAVATIAGNALHARGGYVSLLIAAWPPCALLLALELLARVPVRTRTGTAVRTLATVAISGVAAWVSYWHMVAVTARYGETGVAPYLYPLSVDGLVVVATACLFDLTARIRAHDDPARTVARTQPEPERPRNEEPDPDADAADPGPTRPRTDPDHSDDGRNPDRHRVPQHPRTRTAQTRPTPLRGPDWPAIVAAALQRGPDQSLRAIAAAHGVSEGGLRGAIKRSQSAAPATPEKINGEPVTPDAPAVTP